MARDVLVTGGSNGIGRAVAARFRRAGDRVVITGRDPQRLAAAAAELDARAIGCDQADPAQVSRLTEQLTDGLDVLVNMAGANTDLQRPDEDPDTDALDAIATAWRANLDANLISAVLTTTALRERLRDGATIVNVSSIGAEYASTSYRAAKAAVAAWTAGLSAQVAPTGVTANVIAPGYIAETGLFHGKLPAERRDALIAATHNKRPGTVDDIAETAFFLASPGARHITGQTVHVNGGAFTTR